MDPHNEHFAHTKSAADGTALPTAEWEPLEKHLQEVSAMTAQFAESFHASDWGKLAGLWHDMGKYSAEFQSYLLGASGFEAHLEQHRGKVDHATAGAKHAHRTVEKYGRMIAYIIAGHHAGLADIVGSNSSLESRLAKSIFSFDSAPETILNPGIELSRLPIELQQRSIGFQLAFYTRMLFSCLVDADFLCTERFMSPEKSAERVISYKPFPQMKQALDAELSGFPVTDDMVSHSRREVLDACRAAAKLPAGLFSLTVPTGGGKTLSSLAFALDHTIVHNKSRIIYAIPFTSIIEQTASVFRDLFVNLNSQVVLEHHSNLDPDVDHETPQSRLATENWDAPLVVTTNVQLFESLFAAKTSRCRKLHNLVNSVIILDEVQTLPVDLLLPCIEVLKELASNYQCTIVLCTATQPAINRSTEFPIGLENVREIIPDPGELAERMKRVDVHQLGKLDDEELIDRLSEHTSFLTIVNTRGHAAKLYRELSETVDDPESLFHLSTLMCGQHRSDVIATIRQRLVDQLPCRVISTQLIEAGVDVDFPVVFRALTGIDSIAQAAGRCNREGKLSTGEVFVFEPTDVKLFGYLKSVAESSLEIAPNHADLLAPEAIHEYFRLHYWKQAGENQWDKTPDQGIMKCFPNGTDFQFRFSTAAERFRFIDQNGQTIFVPYGDQGTILIEQLRQHLEAGSPPRWFLRKLQRYTVNLYDSLFASMRSDLDLMHESFPILTNESAYDNKLGVRIDRPGYHEPSSLIT